MPLKTKVPRALLLAEREVPLTVRKVKGARRISIQWRPLARDVLLTLPHYVSFAEALAFAESRSRWLEAHIRTAAVARPFTDGAVIPVFGAERVIRYVPGARGVVREEEGALLVPGAPEFCPRRVKDWLTARAKEQISAMAQEKADVIGRKIARVRLRDTVSRWGSCGSDGVLTFSWRLVFAPAPVLDYIISHEVAHLAHMNHSAAFWRVVGRLCPGFEQSKEWLLRHGDTLYTYG